MKFIGNVGLWEEDVEVKPGVWRPAAIVEKIYTGDIYRDVRKFQKSDTQNDTFTVNNQISILADLYAYDNWPSIKYVEWNNTKWSVSSVEVNYPRLVLEIGGVYNGTNET
jgi:hypothetical protein